MGIGDDAAATLDVYPNPSADSFSVACEEMTQAAVYALDGKLVRQVVANGQCIIDGLSQGVYVLKVESSNGAFMQKIVKL